MIDGRIRGRGRVSPHHARCMMHRGQQWRTGSDIPKSPLWLLKATKTKRGRNVFAIRVYGGTLQRRYFAASRSSPRDHEWSFQGITISIDPPVVPFRIHDTSAFRRLRPFVIIVAHFLGPLSKPDRNTRFAIPSSIVQFDKGTTITVPD